MSQAEAYAAYKLQQIQRAKRIGLIALGCLFLFCLCWGCLAFLLLGGYLTTLLGWLVSL